MWHDPGVRRKILFDVFYIFYLYEHKRNTVIIFDIVFVIEI